MPKPSRQAARLGQDHPHLCWLRFHFVTDYTEPLGHSWDEGTLVTGATCTGRHHGIYLPPGDATRLEGDAAAGHIPGDAATCTTPALYQVRRCD